jgi:hypothetical protein
MGGMGFLISKPLLIAMWFLIDQVLLVGPKAEKRAGNFNTSCTDIATCVTKNRISKYGKGFQQG